MLLIKRLTHQFLFFLVPPGLVTKRCTAVSHYWKVLRVDPHWIENSGMNKAKAKTPSQGSEG